jgi:hypothetical protein
LNEGTDYLEKRRKKMKSRKQFVLIIALLAFSILACQLGGLLGNTRTVRGTGDVVEETRAVSGISGVNLATIGDLVIEVGGAESLRIEAQANLMEYLETEVVNGKLTIGTQDNVSFLNPKPINYYLTVTELESIEISSVGDIEAPDLKAGRFSIIIASTGNLDMGDLEADTLTARISSSGDVTMGVLNANALEVDISSNGNLDIAGGEVKTQNISISSTGKYTAQDLASDEADVRINSTGTVTIWVRERLKARLNSSGDLRYRGNPTVDASTSSSGDVIQISE